MRRQLFLLSVVAVLVLSTMTGLTAGHLGGSPSDLRDNAADPPTASLDSEDEADARPAGDARDNHFGDGETLYSGVVDCGDRLDEWPPASSVPAPSPTSGSGVTESPAGPVSTTAMPDPARRRRLKLADHRHLATA